MLQNLLCLWKKKTHVVFFVFHLEQLSFSPYECPGPRFLSWPRTSFFWRVYVVLFCEYGTLKFLFLIYHASVTRKELGYVVVYEIYTMCFLIHVHCAMHYLHHTVRTVLIRNPVWLHLTGFLYEFERYK